MAEKMPRWVRKGPLYTYEKPESAAEECRRLEESWKEKIGNKDKCCPECEGTTIEETCIGWWTTKEHYHDPNRKRCWDCGHEWFITCPTCGYNKGEVLK